ncbi:MAG TPA: glycosyltransferase family 9 protein [Bacteroidota bacterium]|nr:glycosyltransferase family 9 protein [Bacteroidota bacterium]
MDKKPFELSVPRCKKFSGYKPCFSYTDCLEHGCQHDIPENHIGVKILIISLDAMGNVLYNTSILPAIKRKHPESTIYWITMPSAEKILWHNSLIDRVFVWNDEHRMILRNISFDYLLNADKTDYACSFANELQATTKLGFLLNNDGKIVPANKGALYNYRMGNDDKLKFRENQRSGIDIMHETFDLEYRRDECIFSFTEEEHRFIEEYKTKIAYDPAKVYVGFNTGCSNLFPNKKMTIDQHVALIRAMASDNRLQLVLVGGREDMERNEAIMNALPSEIRRSVIATPTTEGLRKGACYMDICDIVITGDSFGMHLAIALRKYVIAWFGLSCWTEIELFDRGEKLIPEGLECAPCWKKACPYNLECIQMIDLNRIVSIVDRFAKTPVRRTTATAGA